MGLKRVWQRGKDPYEAALLWATSCLCFFGFLKSRKVVVPSETEFDQSTHLNLMHVKVVSHLKFSRLEMCIKASKTDPFRQGFTIHLGAYRALCPVEAMLGFLILRGDGPDTLFKWQSGKFLMRQFLWTSSHRSWTLCSKIRWAVSELVLGRWESLAYMWYIRTPQATLQAVSGWLVSRM